MAPTPDAATLVDAWMHEDVVVIMDETAAAVWKLKEGKVKRAKYETAVRAVTKKLEEVGVCVPRNVKKVSVAVAVPSAVFTCPQMVHEYLNEAVDAHQEENGGNPGLWRAQKWTTHSVAQHIYAEECASRTDELANRHARGTALWLAQYNLAVKEILGEMDEEDAEDLRLRTEQWNKEGLDPAAQEK